jgi:hypothetical protein
MLNLSKDTAKILQKRETIMNILQDLNYGIYKAGKSDFAPVANPRL